METTQPAIGSILIKVCQLNKERSCLDFCFELYSCYLSGINLFSYHWLVTPVLLHFFDLVYV